jgi:hypothetical protein
LGTKTLDRVSGRPRSGSAERGARSALRWAERAAGSGQGVGDCFGGGRLPDAFGEVGDIRSEGESVRFGCCGVEGFVAVDVIAQGTKAGDRAGGEALLLGRVQTDGQAVVVLVKARRTTATNPERRDAMGLRAASPGEYLAGVLIAPERVNWRSGKAK